MKLPLRLSGIFVFSALLSFTSFAQKNFYKEAEKAFRNREFFNAIELYKKAYSKIKKKEEKATILFKTAECYRMTGDAKQSETWYSKAIKAKYPDPKAILYLADAKKAQQKYDEAIIEYNNYKKEVPADSRGEDGVKSSEMAQKWKDAPSRYVVENLAMVNSKQQDFAPAFADKKFNTLYFSSTREGSTGGKVDPGLGQTFSDLFETKVDKNGKWSTPVPIASSINSPANEGASVVARKGQNIYFTRCGVEKKQEAKCQLYIATKKGNVWGEEKKLPFCVDSFAFGHPTITADEQIMLFASDRPGGQGGIDIWISVFDKKAKAFGEPQNLGTEINTSGDEMYPFLREDGSLYYSSSALIGMGGTDIFKADKAADKWEWKNPVNLQAPINSAGDDFGIIFEGKNDRGYFSSNREGGKGSDDIYSFVLPPLLFSLDGNITDCKYGVSLEGVVMRLVGTDGTNVEAKTDKTGYYKFDVAENKARYINANTSYEIATDALNVKSDKADGYLNSSEKGKITTVGVNESKIFKQDFCLVPAETEIRFPAVLYDLDKADLRPESKDSLSFLYQTLIDNPTAVIELAAHTDARASDQHNNKLSQARAQSCVDYLVGKGIAVARLQAKGYGESKPLCIQRDAANPNTCAQALTEQYINSLPKDQQEPAHQRNRRTVFRVLRWDFADPNAPKPMPKILPKVSGEEQGYEDEPAEGDAPVEQPKQDGQVAPDAPKDQPKDVSKDELKKDVAPVTPAPNKPK